MNATNLYKAMLRDQVAPPLRAHGFKGTSGKWILTDPASGDHGIVQAQSSRMSSAAEVWFTINLAVVPAPWWAWTVELYKSKQPSEADGLWHARLHPTTQIQNRGGDPWWKLNDTVSAQTCGQDVVAQLQENGIPRLRQVMHRPTLIDLVRRQDRAIRAPVPEAALAILLSDDGPTSALDDILQRLAARVHSNPSLDPHHFARLAEWARSRAANTQMPPIS